jgi:transposase-like protein
MPPVDRKNPKRAKSSDSRVSFMEFMREYPDDATCLDFLWRTRYAEDGEHAECPKCEQTRSFKKYETTQRRQSWTCTACGHHIHPTAGTIFHKSSTSLHLWFYAIYLMSSTRCGLSAKQLEREIGVNYKTALRMLHLIRQELMKQDDEPLSGDVEVDETYLGGRPRASQTRGMTMPEAVRFALSRKRIVFAAVERGGRVRARVIPNSQKQTLIPATREYVLPGSMVFTDDWPAYKSLDRHGYTHRRINHSARIYVDGDIHTQTIDGFFAHFKNDVRGTHHSISTRWLNGYLNQWVFQWNHRDDDEAQFRTLLRNAANGLA